MTSTAPSTALIRDLYARMLLTRTVDEYARRLHAQRRIDAVASCCGHEAAQIASAICIEVGKDFTLPYYRDLGVVLTIGMTPYEVFRTYLQTHRQNRQQTAHHHATMQLDAGGEAPLAMPHWGYHKHNTVTGPAPVATQLLHAAGIAFASKLRKASVVTVAYCGDGATTEADFTEALHFAALHQLPVIFICEQDCPHVHADPAAPPECLHGLTLPAGLTYEHVDGTDVVAVYSAMLKAMQHTREGQGPVLLEMHITRPISDVHSHTSIEEDRETAFTPGERGDPLVRCQHTLQALGAWDDEWAFQLSTRITAEVQNALHAALRDTLQPG